MLASTSASGFHRGFRDLTVLLVLGTSVALGNSVFKREKQLIWKVSENQLRHSSQPRTGYDPINLLLSASSPPAS
jgi:hypothetical protein